MRVTHTSEPPCCMTRGQVRRVPRKRSQSVLGVHVCCPRCGYVTLVLEGRGGIWISEDQGGQVSFSAPLRCMFCRVWMHLDRDELCLKEDEDVRAVRYR